MIRVTKQFELEMAHRLVGHDGVCENLHGHSYKLSVTISGEPNDKKGDPKDGMVIDFSDMKRVIKETILDQFDHAVLLSSRMSEDEKESLKKYNPRALLVPYQTTAENIVLDFAERLKSAFAGCELFSLKLFETESNCVEWFADDQ